MIFENIKFNISKCKTRIISITILIISVVLLMLIAIVNYNSFYEFTTGIFVKSTNLSNIYIDELQIGTNIENLYKKNLNLRKNIMVKIMI